MGFKELAKLTAKPGKSLHRMLSPKGNPSVNNSTAIFRTVREVLLVRLTARSVTG
jgi:hypothetical protein